MHGAHAEGVNAPKARLRVDSAGFSSIELAIGFVAVIVVGTIMALTTIGLSSFAASEGKGSVDAALENAAGAVSLHGGALAVGGSVDVDGDDSIDLEGVDEEAVVQVAFILKGAAGGMVVDLTPPHTADDTGTDPDDSGLESDAVLSFTDPDFETVETAWTVEFFGDSNGDYFLDDGERAEVTVWLNSYDNANAVWDLGTGGSDPYVDTTAALLQADTEFNLQLHLKSGGVFTLQRVTPRAVETSMDLR